MLKISFPGCIGLSSVILTQFTLEMCVAASNHEKNSLKTPILGFKVIDVGTPWKLVSSACYDAQHVHVYLQQFSCSISAQWQKQCISKGYPNLMPSYGGLVEPKGSNLNHWSLCLIPNISYQVVLVYLKWFRRNSLLKCVLQPEIAKNSLKSPIFGVQGHRRWYHQKGCQQCLLW